MTDPTATQQKAVFGPFADRAKADRWIDIARDAFDLCRYRAILAQSPDGRACAYKQMNKCPAPCDGTIPLDVYRQGVSQAVAAIRQPSALIAEYGQAMKAHAAKLEFELAGRLKGRLDTFMQLGDSAGRGVRPINAFRFVAVEPGPRKGTAKVFVIATDAIVEVLAIIDPAGADYDEVVCAIDADPIPTPWPTEVLLGLACHHISGAKSGRRFLARSDFSRDAFSALVAEAVKPRPVKEEGGDPIRETRIVV